MSLYKFERNRIYGMVLGLVSNNDDPNSMGRVKVKFHMFDQSVESDWCRVIAMYAGAERGSFWMPEVDDEVVLAFEHGDPNFPFVIGSVWNGKDAPPTGTSDGNLASKSSATTNHLKRIRSRSGHEITFDDTKGKEKLTIQDAKARSRIEIDVLNDKITIEADTGDLDILAAKGKLKIRCKELDIEASSKARIHSGGPLTATCKSTLTVKGEASGSISAKSSLVVESKTSGLSLKASAALTGSCASLSMKATGTGEVKATGNLTIKGAMVYIN